MRKFLALALLFFIANVCVAQLADNFSDGDFTVNPPWLGSTTNFIVNGSNQLQLNNTVAGTSYLSTPFSLADLSQVNTEWQVYVKQTFSPSGSNFGRVYLTSDQTDLTQPLNGYYLQFGESGSLDAVELFRQSGSIATKVSVCRATNGQIATSFELRVKALRSNSGQWELWVDYTGGSNFVLEKTGIDATHTSSSFMGIECVYTKTNSSKFFFDDFLIDTTPIPDTTPPILQSISIVNPVTIDLLFSESLDPAFTNTVFNYSVNQSIGNPSSAALQSDNKTVRLIFANSFKNGYQHELSVSGVKDLAGNVIASSMQNFLYFVPTPVQVKDIIINECYPDPNPVIGLPDQEFVEIYNRSSNPINLAGWELTDRSSTATLPDQIILSQEYWIVTSSAATELFALFGKTLGVSNFPTLNNSGDKIILLDPTGLKVDSLTFNLKWYNDADKQQGGWSIELLNPDTLRYDSANWLASIDASGGTPGKQNSQFENKFDQTPPTWLNVYVVNQNQLQLTFNESLNPASVQNLNNFFVDNQIGSPTNIILSLDYKIITLSFQNEFANGVIDSLSVSGLTDLAGNLVQPSKKSFMYFQSAPIYPKDIIINEFMADPAPIVGLPEAEYIELYNRSTNPIDLADWSLSDGVSIDKFPTTIIQPDAYWIVVSSSVAQQFYGLGNVIGLSNFPSLNNSGDKILLFDPAGLKVDSLTYNLKWYNDSDKQHGGWSLELLNSDTLRYDSANWLASIGSSGGTPGKKNSQSGNFFDHSPPILVSISAINQNQLQLLFNETIDLLSAQTASNYSANNQLGNPESASLSADKRIVNLSFQSAFKNGISNSLTILAVSDLSGNTTQNIQVDFLYFLAQPIHPKDIIITEIMADPVPVVGLPEAEYIEIFNRSLNAIDLLNWTITDGSSVAKFPTKIIQPNEFWIVHSSSSTQLNSYPNRIALASFPSLNKSSDSIVLKSPTSITIDSVAYSSTWYHNSDKQEGGWSLELIDLQNICGEENNWTASDEAKGGTPGKQNSVLANKPDLSGPQLLSIVVSHPDRLLLQFDEKLEMQVSPTSFTLIPHVTVSETSFNDKGLRVIKLELAQELSIRQPYTILVENLRDCNGNVIQEEFSTLQFALPEVADSLDILINEILFNPRPNGADFVEIYNNSPKYINLKNWKLANLENGILKNPEQIAIKDFILPPFTHLALTDDPETVKNNYPNNTTGNFLKSSLPTFPDDEGSVAIVNNQDTIVDKFLYTKTLHSPLIKDDEGVSLERISFQLSAHDQSNWKSATSFSGFATPGYLNSNARPDAVVDESSVLIEPEVFSPNAGQFAKINFRFDQSSFLANVKIFDQQGHLIKTVANHETLNYDGFFRWDGDLEDGSKARFGYYMVWFEVFDPNGTKKTFRKRVIVAND